MTLSFGKYKGIDLESLYSTDKNYLIWLACNSWAVRKEAQEIFTKMANQEVKKIAEEGYTILKKSQNADLNYDVILKIGEEKYCMTFSSEVDFNFKISLEFKQMFFTNRYKKNRSWDSASFNHIKPFLIIIK
jgi:hypothetical protein